jgi:hypothetical protein
VQWIGTGHNYLSRSINGGAFLHYLSHYQLLKKDYQNLTNQLSLHFHQQYTRCTGIAYMLRIVDICVMKAGWTECDGPLQMHDTGSCKASTRTLASWN